MVRNPHTLRRRCHTQNSNHLPSMCHHYSSRRMFLHSLQPHTSPHHRFHRRSRCTRLRQHRTLRRRRPCDILRRRCSTRCTLLHKAERRRRRRRFRQLRMNDRSGPLSRSSSRRSHPYMYRRHNSRDRWIHSRSARRTSRRCTARPPHKRCTRIRLNRMQLQQCRVRNSRRECSPCRSSLSLCRRRHPSSHRLSRHLASRRIQHPA